MLLGIIVSIFLVPLFLPESFCIASIDYAIYVGGLAGPLAALVGFIYVYLTFLGQQRQLDEQRERLDKEDASKEFAEYLNLWNEFRAEVIYTWDQNSGSKAFDSYWKNVRKAVRGDSKKDLGFDLNRPDEFRNSLRNHLTKSAFNKNSGQYEDFIRMIYPLLEIAERGKLDNKLKYLENLLSDGEKAILVYSATFLDQKDFGIKLFKSGFCKSISNEYLISKEHRNLIF
ncbi:hypothetical protein [Algoriphagus hitonicola]|uniref:hypothetical protein n=1 Tax=Algoriphagus hitonicola TaxID=435880 RepID=UPI003605E35C